jgi:hypothetical protein
MPAVIDQTLFPLDTPIPPGEAIESPTIDVSGARHITVNAILQSGSAGNIQRMIRFGYSAPGKSVWTVFQVDSFGPDNVLLTSLPVHGSELQVRVANQSSRPVTLVAWVYGVREAAASGVIDQSLFRSETPIPPGDPIDSPIIDVSGAQHLTVNVLVSGERAKIQRSIVFVHRQQDGRKVAIGFPADTFGSAPQLWTLLPSVHGSSLQVSLANQSSQPARVYAAWVYGVRQAS